MVCSAERRTAGSDPMKVKNSNRVEVQGIWVWGVEVE